MKPEEEDEDNDNLALVEWKSTIQLMGMRGVGKNNTGRECWPCFMEKGERLAYVVQVHDEYRFNRIQDLFVMVLENSNCENWIQIAENNPDLLTVLDFGTSPTRPRAYDNDTRDMCFFQRNTFEHINENQASLNAGNVASFNAVRQEKEIEELLETCFPAFVSYLYMAVVTCVRRRCISFH